MTGLTELTLRDLADRLERKAKDQESIDFVQAETLRIVADAMVEMADEMRKPKPWTVG